MHSQNIKTLSKQKRRHNCGLKVLEFSVSYSNWFISIADLYRAFRYLDADNNNLDAASCPLWPFSSLLSNFSQDKMIKYILMDLAKKN